MTFFIQCQSRDIFLTLGSMCSGFTMWPCKLHFKHLIRESNIKKNKIEVQAGFRQNRYRHRFCITIVSLRPPLYQCYQRQQIYLLASTLFVTFNWFNLTLSNSALSIYRNNQVKVAKSTKKSENNSGIQEKYKSYARERNRNHKNRNPIEDIQGTS